MALLLFTFIPQASGQHLTDYDGNEYRTVIIGYQEWMAENLRTTHFNDGTPLAYPGDDAEAWQADTSGAYAWYSNDSDWGEIYGALYNWHAVASEHGLCPAGWRVPDTDDFWDLYNYATDNLEDVALGDVGNVLKSCRQVDSPLGGDCDTDEHPRWNSHSTYYGTDDLGFSATPGGLRNEDARFFFMGRSAYLWTSSESNTEGRALATVISSNSSFTASTHAEQISGYSIRCVREVEAELPEMGAVQEPRDIRATHAASGGMVTDDGGAPVTARGVVWGRQVPTLENYEGKTMDGTGTGTFTSSIRGLQPATTYHVRAYATNVIGTSYSEPTTFTTGNSVVTAAETPGGAGTEQDPHLISTLGHLVWISENPGAWDRHFLQTADIDASPTNDWEDGKGWNRIGKGTTTGFTGVYDGGGNIIDGLFVNRTETGQGFFGYLTDGAVVKNLGITNANIHGGDWYVGALAGYSEESLIDQCFSTGTVRGTDTNVGGLLGRNHEQAIVSNSYSTADATGIRRVGGLVGKSATTSHIYHVYSTGNVTGGDSYVGGLTGRNLMSNQESVSLYWNMETSGQEYDMIASGKTTGQMRLFTTFLWWDFKGEDRNGTDDIWNIGNGRNDGLPYLSWQYPDDPGIVAEFSGGTGTENDPFLISTAVELSLINFQYMNDGEVHFALTNNIDLNVSPFNEGRGWVPIGTSQQRQVFIPFDRANYFSGYFDGRGYHVQGLFINRNKAYQGLFGYVHDADIRNLGIRDMDIKGGARYVGGLAGHTSSTRIDRCFTTGSVGGVGELFLAPSAANCGGLVGHLTDNSHVTNSYSTAEVSGFESTGGLIGTAISSSVSNSMSTGDASGRSNVGGLIGNVFEGSVISNSYSHGNVILQTGDSDSWAGGFAGYNLNSSITNSYATGSVIFLRAAQPVNKGFCGKVQTEQGYHMSGNYWDTETSGQSSTSGNAEGKTTDQMTFPYADGVFAGWDFESVWQADEDHSVNNGYPYLRDMVSTGLEEDDAAHVQLPSRVQLEQNYPNPFNPVTNITFYLPETAEVRLEVFDVTGRRVALLVDEERRPGRYQVVFDASELASGVYLGRLQVVPRSGAGRAFDVQTRAMTLIK